MASSVDAAEQKDKQTNETATMEMSDPAYRRELGDGLVLRWSTTTDAERLGRFYSIVFRDRPEWPPNQPITYWVQDMLSGRHPLIDEHGFALVENAATGEVVAATCLINQTWEYEDIALPVGRPEIVGSLIEYRRRGLVREIFKLIHARSAALGHLAQGITGIAYYYRQFGYELELGGDRAVALSDIPALAAEQEEPYTLRDATLDDLPTLMTLYEHERERANAMVWARMDEPIWRWVLDPEQGMNPAAGEYFHALMIVDRAGKSVGYILAAHIRWGANIPVWSCSVLPGVSLVDVAPSLLHGLRAYGERMVIGYAAVPPIARIRFELGSQHPLYDALEHLVRLSLIEPPYAWYVRVPDLPAFIRTIAPVLERRLANSVMAGHTGELALDFYRGGLRMVFEQGKLVFVEDWRIPVWGKAQAGFPPLVFLQMLFGRRSLSELQYILPDVWADGASETLLGILFPKRHSVVKPME